MNQHAYFDLQIHKALQAKANTGSKTKERRKKIMLYALSFCLGFVLRWWYENKRYKNQWIHPEDIREKLDWSKDGVTVQSGRNKT